jgi:hypothetical protein
MASNEEASIEDLAALVKMLCSLANRAGIVAPAA